MNCRVLNLTLILRSYQIHAARLHLPSYIPSPLSKTSLSRSDINWRAPRYLPGFPQISVSAFPLKVYLCTQFFTGFTTTHVKR